MWYIQFAVIQLGVFPNFGFKSLFNREFLILYDHKSWNKKNNSKLFLKMHNDNKKSLQDQGIISGWFWLNLKYKPCDSCTYETGTLQMFYLQQTTPWHATGHRGWSRWRTPVGGVSERSTIHQPLLPERLYNWHNVHASPCHRTPSTLKK